MNKNKIVIIENVNLQSIFLILMLSKNLSKVYYIYSPNKINQLLLIFFKIFNFKIHQLDFKMIDIRNKKGEIYRETIPNNELFEFENSFQKFLIDFLNKKKINISIKNYILKSIFSDYFFKKESPFRIAFLINVINQIILKKNKNLQIFYIISNIPCFNIYKEYANTKNITLKKVYNFYDTFKKNLKIITYNIKAFNYIFFNNKKIYNFNSNYKLFCEGASHPNLLTNGEKSDFFWLINSNFDSKNVLYNTSNLKDSEKLNKYGIVTTKNLFSNKYITKKINNIKSFTNFFNFDINKLNIYTKINDYNFIYNKWYSYFKTHNVKIFLNWYKYDSQHIPIGDAINDLNGISTFFQQNFDGISYYHTKLFCDLNFCYNKYSVEIEKQTLSKIENHIITGYPSNPITNEMYIQASKLRNKILNTGVEKIVCVLDENSTSDPRWHTGHQLQKDNYIYIIEEMIKNEKLGIIFKPKCASNLRMRLGEVSLLLDEALKTKRCFIYDGVEENSAHYTNPTPTLAALSSDLIIHGHLCAGTAAIETALIGKPTILIDREKTLDNMFYNTIDNNFIFSDWKEAIYAFNNNIFNKASDFGNWKETINHFDPFNDGKGAQRIGNFLNDLINGYKSYNNRYKIIDMAIENYINKWGKDKVYRNVKK